MTIERALELLPQMRDSEWITVVGQATAIYTDEAKEAFNMAISALEKQGWHNARKDPPKRPDGMWNIYCVYTRFDRCGIAKYYAHGKWDGYDEDGDQIGEYEIIAYCNFTGPYTEEDNDQP